MYKVLPDGIHAEVLDFPGVISFGKTWEEAKRLLASALVDRAATALLAGEALPRPNSTLTEAEADLEEPIHCWQKFGNCKALKDDTRAIFLC
jgi:hypothetical protein